MSKNNGELFEQELEEGIDALDKMDENFNTIKNCNGKKKIVNRPDSSPGLIIEKMIAIMADIKPIRKGRKNESQGFMYRSIDDVYNAIHEIMVNHRVFCCPHCRDFRTEVVTNKEGKIRFRSCVIMDFYFVAEDGSSICISTPGEGVDGQDKATGKAVSYADKDALIKAFKIPTDEGSPDPDKDDEKDLSGRSIDELRKLAIDYVNKQNWPDPKMKNVLESINSPGTNKGYLEMIIEGKLK